jgi:predicted dehydrogenase
MPEAQRIYRGAIVGLGGVAQHAHLPAYLQYPQVRHRLRLVLALDENPGVPPPEGIALVQDRDALLARGPLDFVDICTPTATHLELATWALAQGFHVLCEKPVAVSRAQAAQIAAAAAASRRVVVPCHQYRYNPAWRTLRRWLEEGRIGRWHLAQFEVHRPAADPGTAVSGTPWRGQRCRGLGGVLLDHGTHLLYQVADLAGLPLSVRAWTGRLRHAGYDVEDTAQLVLDFGDRAAVLLLTWAGHRRENRIRFVGDRGAIEWSGGLLVLEADGRREVRDFTAQLDKRAYRAWFAELFGTFADAMDRLETDTHLADIEQVATLLEACYRAADEPGVAVLAASGIGRAQEVA